MKNEIKSTKHLKNKTQESLIWYSTLPLALHFVRFANSIVLDRILLPSDLGIIGLVSVILYYCDTLTNLGFGSAIIQHKQISEQHYQSFFSFNLFISIVLFITAQYSAEQVAIFFNIPEVEYVLPLYSGLFIISAFAIIPTLKLKRRLEFKAIAIIDVLKVAISISISLTLALNGFGFWSILFASLVSQIVMLILLFIYTGYTVKLTHDLRPLKELFNFSSWSFVNGQFKLLSDNIDKLLVGKELGAAELGYYDKAIGLMKMPADQISAKLGSVSFSSFSRFQTDKKNLFSTFKQINLINSLVMIPIFIGLIWTSEPLIWVLLGEKWMPIVTCMKILGVSYIFLCLSGPKLTLCLAAGKVKQQTIIRGILTCLLIVNLISLPSYNITTIAIYIAIYNGFSYVLSLALIATLQQSWTFTIFKDDLIAVIPSILMCIGIYMFEKVFGIQEYVPLLIWDIIIGTTCYAVCIMLLPSPQYQIFSRAIRQFSIKKKRIQNDGK